ncbi:MAG TPA: hypothetical protein G4O15_15380 [Dehalococcoidia bacterium]|nr:hypothetical protein [Dehalococcoidia bacterium]
MDEKIAYFNDLLVRLEEIFYHELSGMTHPKVEYVGIDFLRSKNIEGTTVEEILDNCIKEITAGGLAEEVTYSRAGEGILLILKIKNCIHIPMEAKLQYGLKNEGGVAPYMCPIANMILDRILEVLKFQMVYNASIESIDTETGECSLKCVIYESVEKIGQVGDWRDL